MTFHSTYDDELTILTQRSSDLRSSILISSTSFVLDVRLVSQIVDSNPRIVARDQYSLLTFDSRRHSFDSSNLSTSSILSRRRSDCYTCSVLKSFSLVEESRSSEGTYTSRLSALSKGTSCDQTWYFGRGLNCLVGNVPESKLSIQTSRDEESVVWKRDRREAESEVARISKYERS